MDKESRDELIGRLYRLTEPQFGQLLTAFPNCHGYVDETGAVVKRVLQLIQWAESAAVLELDSIQNQFERLFPQVAIPPLDHPLNRQEWITPFEAALQAHEWVINGRYRPLVVIIQGNPEEGHWYLIRRLCGAEGTANTLLKHVGVEPFLKTDAYFLTGAEVGQVMSRAAAVHLAMTPGAPDGWKDRLRKQTSADNRFSSCALCWSLDELRIQEDDFLRTKAILEYWTETLSELQVRLIQFISVFPPKPEGFLGRLRSYFQSPERRYEEAMQRYRIGGHHHHPSVVVLDPLKSVEIKQIATYRFGRQFTEQQRNRLRGRTLIPYEEAIDILNLDA